MAVSFKIPYPATAAGKREWARRYGLNAYYAGKHWAQRRQDAAYWHTLAREEMERQKVRKRPFAKPVCVTFCWNDGLDIDNHAAMGKMIVDACKGRLIADDGRRRLCEVRHRFHNRDYILVTVEEIANAGDD